MHVWRRVGRCSVTSALLLSMLMLGVPMAAYAADDESVGEQIESEVTNEVPQAATEYVEGELSNIQGVATELGIDESELKDVSLGTPYIVYDVDAKEQDESYSYPLINDDTGNVILIADVMGTTDGWSYDMSTDMADELNSIDYPDNPCIFYGDGDTILADDSNSQVTLSGTEIDSISAFASESFSDKVEAISTCLDNLQATDTKAVKDSASTSDVSGYTPTLTTDGSIVRCDLYNKKGQGDYKLCWAASVATTINYRKGTDKTAKNVADKIDIGYNKGASITVAKKALQSYGCTAYDYIKSDQISWDKVKENINDKKPIYMAASPGGDTSKMGHAITIYGHKKVDNTKYLITWNSGLNGGAGGKQIIKYKANTSFEYGSTSYTWTASLYAED